jgi:hypothetical protein
MMKSFPPVTCNNRKLWAHTTEPIVALKQFLTFDAVVQYSYSLFLQNSLQNKYNNSQDKKTQAKL